MAGEGVRLVAGGDIMLGEHPVMVGRGVLSNIYKDPEYSPFAGIRDGLQSADIVFGNLECALRDLPAGTPVNKRDCIGPSCGVSLLKDAGFTVLNIANNHAEQHGTEALRETVSALEDAGISVAGLAGPGAGRGCRPTDLDVAGMPLRFLGYSLRPRQHFEHAPAYAEGDEPTILDEVRAGTKAGRIVVVSLHWGDEFVDRPARGQVEFARALVDAGAKLVLGHHPHVLQGWELRGRSAIVYSLGNLVFDMPWLPTLRQTALFSCRLDAEGVHEPAWSPLVLDSRHTPQPATPEEARTIHAFLENAKRDLEAGTGPLAPPNGDEYSKLVRSGLAGNRIAGYRYFLRNAWRYQPAVVGNIVGKFVLRRIGLLRD